MDRRVRRDLRAVSSARRAAVNQWFFKTGPGDYGENDRFLGIRVPDLRRIARAHQDLPLNDVLRLLRSKWHEERLLALLILVRQYARAGEDGRRRIHRLYLRNTRWINNWDLVDSSAAPIVGAHLGKRERTILRRLARSTSVWERRIAMIATSHYIRNGDFADALAIAGMLVKDEHDLIQKAVGWMLREIGNRDRKVEERFLKKHARTMPRTMLRYAIEKFPDRLRRQYLSRREVRQVRRGSSVR
jgi:3-methyladenine DNA glycosylase AlkD